MAADLHTHSTFSDGTTTPTRNAELAAHAGLRALALTDHDTTEGWSEAAAGCAAHGLEFVPGLELSTEWDGRSVHLLGFWVDPGHPGLAAECARLRDERFERARRMVGRLVELGLPLSMEAVEARAGRAPIGRPHVAAAMVEAGVVPDLQAAFDRYLAEGRPAYVPKHALDPEQGAHLLIASGGVAVLAHPGPTFPAEHTGRWSREARNTLRLIDRLTAAGLAGLEADHSAHDPATALLWRRVAARRGLLVTGGSDFHGDAKDVKIGQRATDAEGLEALRQRARTGMRAQGGPAW
ncbi:MAG: PHP domain-containing protein [Actinomycetota bacterium]|nr:PHP domain-containing protein [Actinomycetota bacterium]